MVLGRASVGINTGCAGDADNWQQQRQNREGNCERLREREGRESC